MKKEDKAVILAEVTEKLKKANGIYLTEFSGLTVEQVSNLRNQFRKAGIEYKVVKNTLIKKALKEAKLSDKLVGGLKNTTALALSYDDPIAPAKIIKQFSGEVDKLKFKMASIEGAVFESNRLNEIAGMAGRVENIAKAIGIVNQVIVRVPSTMNAVMRGLMQAVNEVAKKQNAAA